jgi:hypothetical protein
MDLSANVLDRSIRVDNPRRELRPEKQRSSYRLSVTSQLGALLFEHYVIGL